MKVECSCGAKYEFEVSAEMRQRPVKFICPACGLDASEFVGGLIRRELGQTERPVGDPVLLPLTTAPTPVSAVLNLGGEPAEASEIQPHSQEPQDAAAQESFPLCAKHPGQVAAEKCYICSRPICPKCMELFGYVCSPLCKAKAASHGIRLPLYQGQKSVVEARRWRKFAWAGSVSGGSLAALFAVWFWYVWFGSAPKSIFSVRFPEPAYSGQSAVTGNRPVQIIFLHGGTLARYDLNSGKQVWSHEILEPDRIQRAVDSQFKANKAILDKANSEGWDQVPRMPSVEQLKQMVERQEAAALSLFVRGLNIWVCSPQKLVRYEWETGQVTKQVPVQPGLGKPTWRGEEILLAGLDAGRPVVTRINLSSGETRTQNLDEPDPGLLAETLSRNADSTARQNMAGLPQASPGAGKPIDPARAAAQAQRMSLPERIALPATMAANMNQQRALNELNDSGHPAQGTRPSIEPGSSFSLIPARDDFVEFSVKLLEARVVSRSAMKPGSGKSTLDGDVTAGKSMDAASDMLNEMQRSNGGDIVQEDHSRYAVSVRRPGTDAVWTGEVVGPPKLYALDTVTVVAADKLIIVLNKLNRVQWQSTLAYNIPTDLNNVDAESATYGQGPFVERKGSLYVFDAGVLSAFDLASGNARWRLPTVGVAGLFFDEGDMLYVNTTTASHESLKYSRQIDLSRKVISVILKVDSRNGKILWSQESEGLVNYVSGKLILTAASFMPEEQEGPETGLEKQPWLRIRRINSSNGREVWEHYQDRAPLDIAFEKNTVRLVFKKEVQVLRYPTF